MKYKKQIASLTFILLSLGGLKAQENTTASGGEAKGSGGVASYSVGQIVYTTDGGSNGSVNRGLQQPYVISEVLGVEELITNLDISVFPNPSTDFLKLEVENKTGKKLSYQLVNVLGKIIRNKEISTSTSTINMIGLPRATYFLRVNNKNQPIKTFKIIKN